MRPFSGRVASVHDRAVNIAPDAESAPADGRGGDPCESAAAAPTAEKHVPPASGRRGRKRARSADIVSVVADPAAMTVTSVCVDGALFAGGRGLQRGEPAPGDTVTCDGRTLRLGRRIVVRFAGAPRFEGTITPVSAAIAWELVSGLAEAIVARGEGVGLSGLALYAPVPPDRESASRESTGHRPRTATKTGLESPPGQDHFVAAAWKWIAGALECPAEPWAALSRLVGLGVGMTPSGDDFLVGFLAARALAGRDGPDQQARGIIEERTGGTTPVGATIVRQALAGHFPGYLIDVVHALVALTATTNDSMGSIAAGAGWSVAALVDAAARHGHSSGLDALTGLLFGLTTSGR